MSKRLADRNMLRGAAVQWEVTIIKVTDGSRAGAVMGHELSTLAYTVQTDEQADGECRLRYWGAWGGRRGRDVGSDEAALVWGAVACCCPSAESMNRKRIMSGFCSRRKRL